MREVTPESTEAIAAGTSPPECEGYRVLAQIGEGSYGTVWLAEDAVGKPVALKVIDRQRLGPSSAREERAVRLVRTRLPDHPNLVRIDHVGMSQGRIWYVMELADNLGDKGSSQTYVACNLQSELEARGPLSPTAIVEVLRALLRALDCLHTHGLVHRDVKPSNVLRVGNSWKLADIGLVTEHGPDITSVGTLEFQPSTGPMDATADLFAVGRVLYCLLTGNPARSFPALPAFLLTRERRAATAALNDLALHACATDPARRFLSVSEFAAALDRAEARLSVAGNRPRWRTAGLVAILLIAGLSAMKIAINMSSSGHRAAAAPTASSQWEQLFDGKTLDGWVCDQPGHHGTWSVQDGALTVVRDGTYKSLDTTREFGYGRFRATVTPGHDGARLGLAYGTPRGAFFLLMGDKYTWISSDKDRKIADVPGKWLSFPGPIPKADESVVLEVEYGPDRTRLFANGTLLSDAPGVTHLGKLGLHVWSEDSGSFRDIGFQPMAR